MISCEKGPRRDDEKVISRIMLHRSRARAAAVPLRRYLHTLMFSGQGTQHPGMAKDLYGRRAARNDAVDDELGFSLTSHVQ